jgi:hypothetical protein
MKRHWLPGLLWTIVIAGNLYFIFTFAINYFNSSSLNKDFGLLLIMHIIFGMIALLLGPIQFFPSIRKRNPSFHRLTGKIYLLAILFGSITAIILAVFNNIITHNRVVFGTGLLGLAAAWLTTSGMAFWAIRKRNFVQHREWMVKSYVVTCGFTTYRLFAVTLNTYFQLDYNTEMSGIMAWACWAVPLLVTESLLQAKKIAASARPQKVKKAGVISADHSGVFNQAP